ncbi:MAG: RlmE family RNA methyltransferase [Myxococcota bacterium]
MARRGSGRSSPYKRPDRFTKQAQREGYAARSVYKLQEIQRRQPILRRGQRVVDLGCAPGSWFVYAAEQVGERGVVVGVDLEEPVSRPPWAKAIVGSALDTPAEVLREALGGPADVVLSDMAPRTTGDPTGDHFVQIELARRALALAAELLVPGGAFVCKVVDGEDAPAFVDEVRAAFDKVKRYKPEATRDRSREFFVVGAGFKGATAAPPPP